MKTTRKRVSIKHEKKGSTKIDRRKVILHKRALLSIFQVTCFSLAGYMVYVQIKTYCANQDLSITTHKNFKNEAEDGFPTFTICANGRQQDSILKRDKMPNNYSAGEYSRILIGAIDDHMNYSRIRFDLVAIDVNELISVFYTSPDKGNNIMRAEGDGWYGKLTSNFSLKVSHLDPRRVCVSKDDFQKYTLVDMEYIEFALLYELKGMPFDLHFFIHQKGQLLRSLKYPKYRSNGLLIHEMLGKYNGNKRGVRQQINLKVISVDVLRKRANSIESCDPRLHNEDNKIRHSIINVIGCIPAFTKPFLNQSLLLNDFSTYRKCNKSQYDRIYKISRDFLETKSWYTQPCTTMSTIVSMTDSIKERPAVLAMLRPMKGFGIDLKLEYLTGSYRETVNKLAFDMATLWSQVGGFIGIFLGYSLLQVPELVENWCGLIKSFF